MAGFRINTRKHIDGMIGISLMVPFFFWLVPKMLKSDQMPVETAYTIIIIVFALIINAMAMSWFLMVKKVHNIEYRVGLILLAGGLTVGTFVLGMFAGDIYLAVLGSVVVTYFSIYYRCQYYIRQQ